MRKSWKNFWRIVIILCVIGVILCVAGIALGAQNFLPLQVGGTSVYISSSGIGFYLSDEQAAELADVIEEDVGEQLEEAFDDFGEKIEEALDGIFKGKSSVDIKIDID